MFQLEPQPIKKEQWYSLEDVYAEVRGGFAAVASFMHIMREGSYADDPEKGLDELKDSLIEVIFYDLYKYVFEGVYDFVQGGQVAMDSVAFCMNARLNGELYNTKEVELPVRLEHLVCSAFAREKLDRAAGLPVFDFEVMSGFFENDESESLSVSEVAILAHMDVQSVRNACQPSKSGYLPTYKKNGRALVKADDAAEWLKGRNNFIPRRSDSSELQKGIVEVPFASDGSHFGKTCKQGAGYKVGRKGDERYIENIEDALKELRKMPVAYWRRPNSNGRFGIVRGAEWKVIPEEEFK